MFDVLCFSCFLCFLCFLHFLCVWNLLVKKYLKLVLIPSSTTLLMYTPLNLLYDHHLWGSFFYGNFFCLWESLFIPDHLWGSFLSMRISSYLWLSVRISSFYENLFLFMIVCENLFLFMINYFITYFLLRLPICAYLFSSPFIIQNLFSSVRIENLHEHKLLIFFLTEL